MQDNGLPKAHLAPRIGVSSQYVNLLDTGNEHASFESHSRKNKQSRILKSNSVYFGGEDEIRTRGRITPTSV